MNSFLFFLNNFFYLGTAYESSYESIHNNLIVIFIYLGTKQMVQSFLLHLIKTF